MAKLICVSDWVRRECDRIEAFCGDFPEDWLSDCAENAQEDYTDEDGVVDWECVEYQIECDAENYMNFIETYYPERLRKTMEERNGNGEANN